MTETRSKKVIVIGAGLGGISAAASLAAEGFNVEMYEKNSHIGGKLNMLEKEGFSFDLGPSILTLPHIFSTLFTRVGKTIEDYVPLVELSLHWRCFFEDGTIIDLYSNKHDIEMNNPHLRARDHRDLGQFLEYSKHLYEFTDRGYFKEGLDTLPEMIKFYGIGASIREFNFLSTMHKGIARRINNPYLLNVLDFFVKYVGSSTYNAPGILNLMHHVQFEFGLWYVRGGMYNLARGLRRLLEELNVQIHLDTEVVEMSKEGDHITGIRLRDGSVRNADFFISNMEVIPAYSQLLHEDAKFLKKFEKFEPACSGLVLHLGVDREYPQLGHHSFFFSTNPRKHFDDVFRRKVLPEDPTIYVVAPCRTDPSQAPEGCENIKILPHIPYIQDTPFTQEAYLILKERVLDKLERMGLKDLRKHIIVEDMWTPEDIQRLYYSNRGAIYGVVSDRKKNLGIKAPKQSKKYCNLFFVGGSVNPGGGMPMVVLSGQQVRDKILSTIAHGLK